MPLAEITEEVESYDVTELAPDQLTFDLNVQVPMRDGVTLLTDVYRPSEGAHPVIIMRNPYNRRGLVLMQLAKKLATRGWAVVMQNTRGRYGSGGTFRPFMDERNDGQDTLLWLSQLPWSNGRVVLLGWSYMAYANYLMMGDRLPHGIDIKAAACCMEVVNPFRAVFRSGAMLLHWALPWSIIVIGNNQKYLKPCWIEDGKKLSWDAIFSTLPLSAVGKRLALEIPQWEEWLSHPWYDTYWKRLNGEAEVSRASVPVLHVTGWFDGSLAQTIAAYQSMSSRLDNQQLIIGPWDHENIFQELIKGILPPGKIKEVPYQGASFQLFNHIESWFRHWVNDDPDPISRDAQVHYFVKGEDHWSRASHWPPSTVHWTKLYLAQDGMLVPTHPPNQIENSFLYDPKNPVPTIGGDVSHHDTLMPGPFDQRPVEHRPDTLAYSTPCLQEPIKVAGPIKMVLFAATTATDTDFTVKLVDVHPNQVSEIVQDGIIRGRYLESSTQPKLLLPGHIYKFTVDLIATAHLFKPEHMIRVLVSSSNFPKFDRNLNTGKPFATDDEPVTAQQTIYAGGMYASYLEFPVVDESH